MNSLVQLRLQRFVDREAEMRGFCAALDQSRAGQRVSVVWGDGGIGKSTLLDRMEEECELRGLDRAKVVWNETRNHDFLGVMRKLRDDLGAERFAPFSELVNLLMVPQAGQARLELVVGGASIAVAQNLRNRGSIDAIVGAEVNIRDLNVTIPNAGLGINESERMTRLTDVFFQDLASAAASRTLVLFLDAFEKASEITRHWVCNELVGAALDGRLGEVQIVIGGRIRPDFPDAWWSAVNEMHLSPWRREHVIEYIHKSELSVGPESIDVLVDMLLGNSDGVPGRLEGMVRATVQARGRWAA